VNTLLNGYLLFHLSLLVSLHYLGKDEPQKLGLFVLIICEITKV